MAIRNVPPAHNRETGDLALAEAVADSEAVLDQIVLGKLTPSGSGVVLAGHSRGGFLSLALAARRAEQIAAVINFSGGWLGFQPQLRAGSEGQSRRAWHQQRLARFGMAYRGPTLWLYADRDSLYSDAITRQFHAAFTSAGGQGDYHFVAAHGLENGHLLIQESPLWALATDHFLDTALPVPAAARRLD